MVKELLSRVLHYYNMENRWPSVLPKVERTLNLRFVRSMGMAPCNVSMANIGQVVWRKYGPLYRDNKVRPHKYNVGDQVRLRLAKSGMIGVKESAQSFSTMIYTISRRRYMPYTWYYKLALPDGSDATSWHHERDLTPVVAAV